MPRPRSLTDTQIAAAALAVIDRDGLAALTMRAVAKELGMGTMSLYRYVDDREQLEGLVVERVLGAVDTTPPAGSSWRERLATMVERVRGAVGAHPQVVPLMLTHRQSSPSSRHWAESVLGILTEAGIDGERRVIALRGLLGYLIGAIQLEHLGPLSGTGTRTMAALPGDDFPLLAETARQAAGITLDEEFHRGLAILLNGLADEARAGGRPRSPARRR
ncbi:TetR/AcrR family transcriptional regulator [Actinoallomurus purpureus]|uniref:TetR/AcrR family transcriptional regulator n=1 Tax=Actinoallomurus purpureus TaxID=478114 RepID=UPI0020928E4C|nr:TetR/AcrR family transcriptional regulator [Actinoallomurus purpureus]MCO6007169.1 TetR/AcrR family transcriptional regulator [Actinoallomurus purpureus]